MNPAVRRACCVIAAALVLTLFASAPATGGIFIPPWDKFAHLAFYGTIAVLLTVAFGPSRWPVVVVVVCLIGAADEAYQSFLPGRQAGLDDLAMDVIAAFAGALIARWFLTRVRPPD
jgi:VanZ family protein